MNHSALSREHVHLNLHWSGDVWNTSFSFSSAVMTLSNSAFAALLDLTVFFGVVIVVLTFNCWGFQTFYVTYRLQSEDQIRSSYLLSFVPMREEALTYVFMLHNRAYMSQGTLERALKRWNMSYEREMFEGTKDTWCQIFEATRYVWCQLSD